MSVSVQKSGIVLKTVSFAKNKQRCLFVLYCPQALTPQSSVWGIPCRSWRDTQNLGDGCGKTRLWQNLPSMRRCALNLRSRNSTVPWPRTQSWVTSTFLPVLRFSYSVARLTATQKSGAMTPQNLVSTEAHLDT